MYKAAIIGLGNIGWRFDERMGFKGPVLSHATACLRNEKTILAAGCAPDARDRRDFAQAFQVPVFAAPAELLAEIKPDIVSICSPVEAHFDQVRLCLEHDIPMIWLEKPPVEKASHIQQLIEALQARQKTSNILVNFQRRYTEAYYRLKNVLDEERLGPCRQIFIQYSKGLEANGSHMIDILFYLLGDREELTLNEVLAFSDRENPSFALSSSRAIGVIVAGCPVPYHCIDITLLCDQGRIGVLQGGMRPSLEKKREHELFPGFYRLQTDDEDLMGKGGFEGSMENALQDLIGSHENHRLPQSNLLTAFRSQCVVEEIRARQGRGA